jgi:hypothetical protein
MINKALGVFTGLWAYIFIPAICVGAGVVVVINKIAVQNMIDQAANDRYHASDAQRDFAERDQKISDLEARIDLLEKTKKDGSYTHP